MNDAPATITSSSTTAFLGATIPSLFLSVPNMECRQTHDFVSNPFLEFSAERHPTLANRVRPVISGNGVVDGYIKMEMFHIGGDNASPAEPKLGTFRFRRQGTVVSPDDGGPFGAGIPLLPPNFSTGMKLDRTDEKLWFFHLVAYCPGRMLLSDNYWCKEVVAIAVKDDCARHALLAFATAYVLDYEPTEEMRKRANHHYRTAVQLLDQALNRENTYTVGQDDGIVVAMILMLSSDIVNWESRRPKGKEPLWLEGSRAARLILDRADPGHRYWKPQNVQSSAARIGNANWIASIEICAQPVTALSEENTKTLFLWLLWGSKVDAHKIQGVTGVCPKLLHIFSQITHLAAFLKKDPKSIVVPEAASRIQDRLANFWQWSDASPGHPSTAALMESCVLDKDGKVSDSVRVTELSAHSWIPAAEIYLHMRVFRKPRSHPHVLRSLKVLVQCVKRLPCTGKLFTSQSPFFPVFLMAVASYREEDREVARQWFEVVLGEAQCRSSVPPVWTAIQKLWHWLDKEVKEQPYDEEQLVGDRQAWWEDMVDELVKESGVLSLV
ncbi:fungal-specific transcription factor domain-containing protein [Lasiosphaeria miniovina]|uniref:Fungal-specific transcription factor domain-containing protein n=1 Tax=Lasiosphaeria miniovina TaxID=1954250 RepID=A0AA40DK19_9PEZI|nr:fungal-specific transcription factor domain-containing protein [Lasiosphaeria miniovina]KAK0703672.1 fungal-specific transcription factor domain-containing protein [Lasiosphaeria miniovina]